MNVLVTGASGFLGRHLVRELQARQYKVTELSSRICDLRKSDSLAQFDGQKFDKIFHLAAWTQAGDFCLHHPGEQWIINQQINTNVLSWWHRQQPQAKLIAIGTSCSYDSSLALKEENYLRGQPIESLFTYAMSKRMLHTGLLALAKQFGLKFLTVVPSTLYGPGYHKDGRQMHFIFDLIRKIVAGKKHGSPVVLWGNGFQKREIVHVHDFAKLMLELDQRIENDIVNIGSGQEFTIREFAQQISGILDFDFFKIEFDTARYTGATSKCLNIEKLHSIIPDFKMRPLEQGLAETIRSFVDDRREKELTQ